MHHYNTVSEAVAAWVARGYTKDFNVNPESECLVCKKTASTLSQDDFWIDEVYRFEGMTDPGDEMILYAISSPVHNIKGILLNAYGVYAETNTYNIVKKLVTHLSQ